MRSQRHFELAEELSKLRQKLTRTRPTPGAVKPTIGHLTGQVRTVRAQLETMHGVVLDPNTCIQVHEQVLITCHSLVGRRMRTALTVSGKEILVFLGGGPSLRSCLSRASLSLQVQRRDLSFWGEYALCKEPVRHTVHRAQKRSMRKADVRRTVGVWFVLFLTSI